MVRSYRIAPITFVLSLIVAGMPGTSGGQCVDLPDPYQAVGWWPLDYCNTGGANDMVSTIDAVLTNACLALPQPGKVACGLTFGFNVACGGYSSMVVPSRPELDVSTDPGMTIFAWINVAANADGTIVSKGPGYEFGLSNGYLVLSLCSDGTQSCSAYDTSADPNMEVPGSQWVWVGVRADASEVRFYMYDGSLQSYASPLPTLPGPMSSSGADLEIGNGLLFGHLTGVLDELMIFDSFVSGQPTERLSGGIGLAKKVEV